MNSLPIPIWTLEDSTRNHLQLSSLASYREREMESQAMERRMNRIYSHLAGGNDESAGNNIFPMNCSSSLNSVMPRCDNRMFFSRQGSASQACFMRQVSVTQNIKQVVSVPEDLPVNCCGSEKTSSEVTGGPMFSRMVRTESTPMNTREFQPVRQEREYDSAEPPKFSRPNRGIMGPKQPFFKKIHTACFKGMEWSPRMDVAEFGFNYVVTIELPGVGISDIRVEVDDRNLIVTGRRSTQRLKVSDISEDSNPTYLRREITQGPYQVVWPLPINVNKDGVSAEFIEEICICFSGCRDGFLQITLPKL